MKLEIAHIRKSYGRHVALDDLSLCVDSSPLTATTAWEDQEPSWSPDGTKIAYTGNIALWPVGHVTAGLPYAGDLVVADRSGDTFDFTPRVAHSGASLDSMPEGGANDSHPVWSPDSRFLAFQHGPGTFTNSVLNPGALYLTSQIFEVSIWGAFDPDPVTS